MGDRDMNFFGIGTDFMRLFVSSASFGGGRGGGGGREALIHGRFFVDIENAQGLTRSLLAYFDYMGG